ncbi:MAG: IS1 family transposase [Prosthecobacter sp.]|nr:IS1 family transposase [Prosthecobacter sp.]
MEKLTTEKRASILRCLVEGNSVASTTRMTGAAKNSILKLVVQAGQACEDYQDKHMMNLPCKVIELDEIWSFVGCKEKAKASAKQKHEGDVWTWTSLCADTKLIPCWHVGERSLAVAIEFCYDLAKRMPNQVQITTDGLASYEFAVGTSFGDVDFAQLVKIYAKGEDGFERCVGSRKVVRQGSPDMSRVSTSYVERSNLTMRMQNRRFTRLTNGFSKKLENHCHMMAISFMSYNYCRKHQSLKETPVQAAELDKHRWTMEEVVEMTDAYQQAQQTRAFEEAFLKLTRASTTPKTHEPVEPLTPWYLDPESGGPNPEHKKPGIAYDLTQDQSGFDFP